MQSLTGDSLRRYIEKISVIGGQDPFGLKKEEWSQDPDVFPPLTYFDMVNYLVYGSNPLYKDNEFKNYKSLDAYDRFTSGWVRNVETYVHHCDVEGSSMQFYVIRGKVNHSQRLSQPPVSCWLIINGNGSVSSCHCTCMAGLRESCSHFAAVMFLIEASVRIREKKTVTQEPAYWLLPTPVKTIEYKPISKIDFTSSKSAKKSLDQTLDGIQDPLDASTPKSAKESFSRKKIYVASDDAFSSFMKSISKFKPAVHSVHPNYAANIAARTTRNHFSS